MTQAFESLVVAGLAYHDTQRGNYRHDVFRTTEDREIYLGYVASAAVAYGLKLHGCLMMNHVHWIVFPRNKATMAQTIRRAHSRFAIYFNRRHQASSGHLWPRRDYSCALDTSHLF